MLKIAITGNIASGKSLFEKFLKDKGFKVLCLDDVTHFLYKNSADFKNFLLKKFNTVNRFEVANVVFGDAALRKELENFIHPLILAEMNSFFASCKDVHFVFVSAALLYEAGFDKYFDKTILITANEEVRLERLMVRNSLSREDAKARIDSQMKEELKKERADYIIDNSGTIEDFKKAFGIFLDKFSKDLKTF